MLNIMLLSVETQCVEITPGLISIIKTLVNYEMFNKGIDLF